MIGTIVFLVANVFGHDPFEVVVIPVYLWMFVPEVLLIDQLPTDSAIAIIGLFWYLQLRLAGGPVCSSSCQKQKQSEDKCLCCESFVHFAHTVSKAVKAFTAMRIKASAQ